MRISLKGYKDVIENIVGLALALLIIGVAFYFFDLAAIKAAVERAGVWAPLALVCAKIATLVLAPLSGAALYPLAGAVFGFWEGVTYLILGDLIGSGIAFYISRLFGRRVVERFARGNVPLIDNVLAFMETTKGFLIARVCFIAFPEAVTYAAGLTRISFVKFILISMAIGIVPIVILTGSGAWLSMGENTLSAIVLTVVALVASGGGTWLFFRMTNPSPKETALPNTVENAEIK